MLCAVAVLVLSLVARIYAQGPEPPLSFHASFDGTLEAVARGDGNPVNVEGPVEYRPGKAGQALLCGEGGANVFYKSAGNLRATAGTVEMWVCPLDWTGDEDEFHVFLEAKDPGWLVFYRYYQGGILTLMGTDAANYRAAAGPRIHWTPGEWHHIAGTWRPRALDVYVDGERVGSVPSPILPERLADTFRVGDHPWHVPRQKQTLVDEIKLYSVPLDEESIARAARGEAVAFTPKILLETTADPDTGTLEVLCDAAGLVGELGAGRTARVELVPADGAQPVDSAEITTFEADSGRCDLSVGDIPEGDYEVRVALLDANATEIARASAPFIKPGPPVWSGNDLGMEGKVLPPWTPLRTDREGSTVECWGRRYEFGTALSHVQSAGAELLSEPVSVEAVIDGRPVVLSGAPCRVEGATDTRAVLTGQAEASGLRASVRHEVEYDGYTWTDLTIDPTQPTRVDELRLTWTMPKDQAALYHADRQKWIQNPAGALPAEGWSSDFTQFFWLGNEDRGLSWYAETDRNWHHSEEKPTLEAVRDGDGVRVTVRLIAEPTEISSRLEYGFGMMATPVRPYPDNARRWRMAPGVRPTFRIIWPNGNMKWYGYPEPEDPEKFAAEVKAAHEQGCRVVPYVNLNYVSAGAPEWQYYGSRWADPARAVTPSDVAAMGHGSMGTCPAIRDWQDFILYRISEMIDRYEVDGIYIDCWSPYPCKVGPCAWEDKTGKVQPTRPVRSYREILRRVYALFHEKRPDPLLMVHMSSQVDIPMLSFTDTILDGEQFRSGDLKDDYLELLPPGMFRAEFMGRNWGPVAFFLPEFGEDYTSTGTPTLAAYLMLHDVNAWPIWSDGQAWNRLYDALDKVNIADAEFHPYWRDSGVKAPPGVLVSSYVGEGDVVLAITNTGEATEARIELDMGKLGIGQVGGATDVVRDDAVQVDGNTLDVPLGRHQGRVVVAGTAGAR